MYLAESSTFTGLQMLIIIFFGPKNPPTSTMITVLPTNPTVLRDRTVTEF